MYSELVAAIYEKSLRRKDFSGITKKDALAGQLYRINCHSVSVDHDALLQAKAAMRQRKRRAQTSGKLLT